jgi:hypothetical protein
MYILTNRLIELSDSRLPLPWYHRAPLGLMSGTPVHVALQAPRERPFGDLIVSLIAPENWRFIAEISASKPDAPGTLAWAYKAAPPLNIIFAEAVTVDSGSRHDARLLLEPYYRLPDEADEDVAAKVQAHIDALKDKLRAQGFTLAPPTMPIDPDIREPDWMRRASIKEGWVHVAGWREALEVQASKAKDAGVDTDKFDLDTAVISADTERRMLRYVFPRKGAVSVSVKHTDRPGAMGEIADVLAGERLNILSSLLRRGSAPAETADLVVVVEPTDDSIDENEVRERVDAALTGLPSSLRVDQKISKPVKPGTVLYPRRPHEIAVRPSIALEAEILAVKDALQPHEREKRPVFVSRRFVDLKDDYSRKVVTELREVLADCGCVALEAEPVPGDRDGRVAPEAVKAKMWASDAAILLVVSVENERGFSENLAHECGFMQGQGKPLLPLVQDDASDSVLRIANFQGLQLSEFSKDSARDRHEPNSIYNAVREWLNREFSPELERT